MTVTHSNAYALSESWVPKDFSEKEINNNLSLLTLKVDELQKTIDKFEADDSPRYSLGGIVGEGIDLIDSQDLYETSIYAPFDVIIHRVNTCILKSWCLSAKPFKEFMKKLSDVQIVEKWSYMDYRKCLPGMYLVDNCYLCVDMMDINPTQQKYLLRFLKENRDITLVYQLSFLKPFDRVEFIEKLEISISQI